MSNYGTIAGIITGHMLADEMIKNKKAKEKAEAEAVQKAMEKHKAQGPRPGSNAHYEQWRAEQLKKKESRE